MTSIAESLELHHSERLVAADDERVDFRAVWQLTSMSLGVGLFAIPYCFEAVGWLVGTGFQRLIGNYSKLFSVPLDDDNLQSFAEDVCRCCLSEADDAMFNSASLEAALQEVEHYKQKLNLCNLSAMKQIAAMRDGHESDMLKNDTIVFHEPLHHMDEEQQKLVLAVVCDKLRQLENGSAPASLVEALTRYANALLMQEECAGLDELLEVQSGLEKVRVQKKAVQVRLEHQEKESSRLLKELEDSCRCCFYSSSVFIAFSAEIGSCAVIERQQRDMQHQREERDVIRTATVQIGLDEEVKALTLQAQIYLGVAKGRLLDSSGSVLDPSATIKHSNIHSGDALTLHVSKIQVQATGYAFAAVLGDGSVVTWGHYQCGGDSSPVQDQLKDVQQIKSSNSAFAAVLSDGSVVSWGYPRFGGDSSAVQEQLSNVQQIGACSSAFAAVLGDGSVLTWGLAECGGDSNAVQHQLKNVQQIRASHRAFAAIRIDGSVVTWGNDEYGGDSSGVQLQLKNVQEIQASSRAFAAILVDGSVVTWGSAGNGGDSSSVQHQLKNVQRIHASCDAFAALVGDGTVVTWGPCSCGGDSSAVQDKLQNVQLIQSSQCAFAAILATGSVVTWGDHINGGDCSRVQRQLNEVEQIEATDNAFAAILRDGSVVTWGSAGCGGDSSTVQEPLKNVQQIQGARRAFAAIRGDGSLITWGAAEYGGCSIAVHEQLK
eukprot:s16_g10.t1